MPEKLSTRLGERGELLSGGQAQRISIARALYKQSKILVFDEATSALDDITEREIRSSINKVTKGRTLLIVAHRLNTIRNSNKIVFLEDGRILTTGTYDELLSKSSKFSDFIKAEEEILTEK